MRSRRPLPYGRGSVLMLLVPLIAGAQSYGLDIFHSSTDAHVIVVQTGTSLPTGANAQYFAILR